MSGKSDTSSGGTQTADAAKPLSAVERYKLAAHRRKFGPPMTLEPTPPVAQDTMWRGLARDGQMRFLVVRCTRAVAENSRQRGYSGEAARLLGETLVASLLLRSTLNPGEQLQLIAHNRGPAGRIVADIWSEGGMRATVENAAVPPNLSGLGEGNLEIARSRGGRSVYRSTVPLQDSISTTVMHYLLTSEQIVSLLRVEWLVEHGRLVFAGGYLVQMMPEGKHEDLERLVANIETLPQLSGSMTKDDPDARTWASALMDGYFWDQVAREEVTFHCHCSHERVLTMLSTLPRTDLEELIREPEAVSSTCEYCGSEYVVSSEQLRGLLAAPS